MRLLRPPGGVSRRVRPLALDLAGREFEILQRSRATGTLGQDEPDLHGPESFIDYGQPQYG